MCSALVEGRSRAEIAAELFRSLKTVDNHCRGVYRKLGVHGQAQLIALIHREMPDWQSLLEVKGSSMGGVLEDKVALAVHAVEKHVLAHDASRYFFHVVEGLAKVLGVDMSGISEYQKPEREIVIIVAFDRGEPLAQLTCQMDGSPCGKTYELGQCVCPAGAQGAFPESDAMRLTDTEGYAGVRLETPSPGPIGCLWVADRKPLEDPEFVLSVLRATRARVSAELGLQIAIDRVEELGGSIEQDKPEQRVRNPP
eukprot:TRINITY_DN46489_c1_g1_i2.p1 TRINITY_DN46489_c1_g1~~TRINITY_DN46489_c1_g1_i2.p1  ORF type:complete len:254 (-),score=27.30 TRINITY_DN46489_c1_g1_i2:151-912(-)